MPLIGLDNVLFPNHVLSGLLMKITHFDLPNCVVQMSDTELFYILNYQTAFTLGYFDPNISLPTLEWGKQEGQERQSTIYMRIFIYLHTS